MAVLPFRNSSLGMILLMLLALASELAAQKRARELGIAPGVLRPGPLNAITDVAGVTVGHTTLNQGDSVRTGVTAIIPHSGNLFREKVPAGVFVGNGFGKLAGSTQVDELGNIEAPIVLTNTLNVAEGIAGAIEYVLSRPGNEKVRSVNVIVGETNDGYLNDIRGRHVTRDHVLEAIRGAKGGAVAEGSVGAGTGTVCFGFKGGIGTSSRRLPPALSGYAVGVLVQTNYGGILEINGAPVGRELGKFYLKDSLNYSADGSCMIVVATDAPLDARNLKRLAARALLGLGATGSSLGNSSGDYVIAFSTAAGTRVPATPESPILTPPSLHNDAISPLFQAVKEATQEAIYNSLFMATTTSGYEGHTVEALPLKRVLEIYRKYNVTLDKK
jgi:D-aminopeptidase